MVAYRREGQVFFAVGKMSVSALRGIADNTGVEGYFRPVYNMQALFVYADHIRGLVYSVGLHIGSEAVQLASHLKEAADIVIEFSVYGLYLIRVGIVNEYLVIEAALSLKCRAGEVDFPAFYLKLTGIKFGRGKALRFEFAFLFFIYRQQENRLAGSGNVTCAVEPVRKLIHHVVIFLCFFLIGLLFAGLLIVLIGVGIILADRSGDHVMSRVNLFKLSHSEGNGYPRSSLSAAYIEQKQIRRAGLGLLRIPAKDQCMIVLPVHHGSVNAPGDLFRLAAARQPYIAVIFVLIKIRALYLKREIFSCRTVFQAAWDAVERDILFQYLLHFCHVDPSLSYIDQRAPECSGALHI